MCLEIVHLRKNLDLNHGFGGICRCRRARQLSLLIKLFQIRHFRNVACFVFLDDDARVDVVRYEDVTEHVVRRPGVTRVDYG